MRWLVRTTLSAWLIAFALCQTAFADDPEPSAIPVLVYHQISTPEHPLPAKSDVTELSRFSEQMAYLHTNGYQAITTRQLVDFMMHGGPVPHKAFVLHFDDGWKSELAALPILERYDFGAAFWIIAGKGIGGDYLDWNDIIALSRNPRYEVYSHTMTHPWDPRNNLVSWEQGKILGKSLADVDWEIGESKRVLEKKLGRPVPYLAWPIGAYNDELIKAAARSGYVALFTIDSGGNEIGGDVLRVRRNQISGFLCDTDDFAAILEGGHPRYCEQRELEKRAGLAWHSDSRHLIISFGLHCGSRRCSR
jgi:peptidoglycan/xylan/chitin deacetylase (PgdA/CDA1 family)